jgi:hypothetical protein
VQHCSYNVYFDGQMTQQATMLGVFNYIVSPNIHALMELRQPTFVLSPPEINTLVLHGVPKFVYRPIKKVGITKARYEVCNINGKLYSKGTYKFIKCFFFCLNISELDI